MAAINARNLCMVRTSRGSEPTKSRGLSLRFAHRQHWRRSHLIRTTKPQLNSKVKSWSGAEVTA
jgi:hypothetical protein